MPVSEIIGLTALEAVEKLKKGEISPVELIDAAEKRTEAVDGPVNAMPIRFHQQAREIAKNIADKKDEALRPHSWLAGLPIGVKDLSHVAGQRTTMGGSPIFKDHIAQKSSHDVQNLQQNGAIAVGKLTSPEFGFNATTYSQLHGYTRNPWDTALSTAGSSGGSAAAVASGQVWMATGSDLGASIRTPASFCGIVGLRPSPGLVPRGPAPFSFTMLPVQGPMARNVKDTALMMDAMVGLRRGDPLSFPAPDVSYLEAARNPRKPLKVGYSVDLGITYCDSEIAELVREAARKLEAAGCIVEEICPDFGDAIEIFHAIRGTGHIAGMAPLLKQHGDLLTDEIKWSVETARKLTADDIADAERGRSELQRRVAEYFESYDLLLCPANVVPPFPVEWTTVKEHEGYKFERYIDWIAITFAITLTACPSLSVPCGFLSSGNPLGLQLVSPPRSEWDLFSYGSFFEDVMELGAITPIDPRKMPD